MSFDLQNKIRINKKKININRYQKVKKQKQLGVFKDMNRNQVMAIKTYAHQTIQPMEWAQGVANAGNESDK